MPLTKVLQKIQDQIGDIASTMELFTDRNNLPTAEDCEQLQKQLCDLQENLAIYKYSHRSIDYSPSFKIHAKISELDVPIPPIKVETKPEPAHTAPPPAQPEPPKVQHNNNHSPASATRIKPFAVGINDKFRFINELFSQNNSEYNIAHQQLTNLSTWPESEFYLNSLKNLYGWKENSDVVKYFYSVVKKRFE
jgi:hypothetical protein